MIKKILFASFSAAMAALLLFQMGLTHSASKSHPQPIASDKAFAFSSWVKDPDTIIVQWKIDPGYYLYKDRFSYKLVAPTSGVLGTMALPPGIPKSDNILGDYQVYKGDLQVEIPIKNISGDTVTVKVCYQGCSEHNFCYPPETKEVTLNLKNIGAPVSGVTVGNIPKPQTVSEQDKITQLLTEERLWLILLSFMGFGLLLSFTPCVLPMIPILSGLIIGHGPSITTKKAFFLSLIYVLSMASTYALLGVLFGLAGKNIQVMLQTPWALIIFSSVFVLLSLSLFGFYELQLPPRLQEKLIGASNKQKGGTYLGVGIMGFLSTVIVSPCVTAPLVGALAYISSTGNAVFGGAALFALGLGMGIPLLIIGTSHGKLLPKSGPWMDAVKCLFGVMLLGVAIWMLERILPGPVTLLLWAALLIISAVYLGILNPNVQTPWSKFWKGVGLLLTIYGILLMIGAAQGNKNPLQPLGQSHGITTGTTATDHNVPLFKRIKSNDDLDHALADAINQNKAVMLDFYADWCIACKEMEFNTFSNPAVRNALSNMVLLQADVTANDLIDKALQERLGVIAPPTILFFNKQGDELGNYRIVGEMGPEEFLSHLKDISSIKN